MKYITTTLLCAALTLAAATNASAYTVDEIIAKSGAVASYKTWDYIGRIYNLSQGVKLEKVDSEHIRIKDMGEDRSSFVFTLSNSSNKMREYAAEDGDYIKISLYTYDENSAGQSSGYRLRIVPAGSDDYSVFKIEPNDKGGYNFTLMNTYVGINSRSGTTLLEDGMKTYSSIVIETFDANATATDKYTAEYEFTHNGMVITSIYPESASVERTYPVLFEYNNKDNRFSILNLGNNGYGYRSEIQNVSNERYHVPNTYSNIEQSWVDYPGLFKIGGVVDPETGKMTFDKNQYCQVWTDGYGYLTLYYTHYLYQLERISLEPGYEVVDELLGHMQFGDDVYHNTVDKSWVSNGGSRRTYEDMHITIEPYTYYLNQLRYEVLNFAGTYEDTEIVGADVTNNVEITELEHGWKPEEGVRVQGHISTLRNDQYVDHYDLMFVKGKYESINDAGFVYHEETGHSDAMVIYTPTTEAVSRSVDNSHDYDFDCTIAPETLNQTLTGGEEYTLFVRTHYKDETKLDPTFHALTTFKLAQVPTGIENVGIDTITADDDLIFDLYGRRVVNPIPGTLYIIGGKKVIY